MPTRIVSLTLIGFFLSASLFPFSPVSASPSMPEAETGLTSDQQVTLTYAITDTMQNKCYNASAEITCPSQGAAFFGQDAQIAGHAPAYTLSPNGTTVYDNITGLTWERSPDTNGDGSLTKADKLTYTGALAHCANHASANYQGFDDWRLPTIKQLYSLIQFNGKDPSGLTGNDTSGLKPFIDTNYFFFAYGDTASGERIIDSQYASATLYASNTYNDGGQTIFGVNFADGRIKGYGSVMAGGIEKTFFVQCARGNTSYGVNAFVNNNDGTITDTATGLMWNQSDSGIGMDWQAALAWAQAKNSQNYLGYNDWRLPNAKDMQSLVDYARSPSSTNSAAIDPVFNVTSFTNEAGQVDWPWYWTSTTHATYNGIGAAGVYISFGRAGGWQKTTPSATCYNYYDVHGAGAQRSDPKSLDNQTVIGEACAGSTAYGLGPQGDAQRSTNYVRLVRDTDTAASHSSFVDVNTSHWAYKWIESLYKAGITGGCSTSPLAYCPNDSVTRAQMAIFLERGMNGSTYQPPELGTGTGFSDVDPSYWAASWIKQLATDGITAGCGNGRYCPEDPVTRAQMAIFLLRSEHGASYTPPTASGVFVDVPVDHWAAAWIEQLYSEGITAGCGSSPLRYCPDSPVTRAQMAVFLVRTFSLPDATATFNIYQTLSDGAQMNTIAFDGLAFLTGNLGADSFFPPGKVADFWGFQYLRDNDPSGMGHNTDFLTRAALNLLQILTSDQRAALISLAQGQVASINQYAYDRFVLMDAFRRLLENDLPAGSTGLDPDTLAAYSADLYRLDGQISYARAQVMGSILSALTTNQRAYLDAMVGQGMTSWPVVEEPLEIRGLPHDEKVAVMTYAGDMFSWYAGSIPADVYFCPERQGTYFGSFYMKDAPAVGNPGYTIPSNLTAEMGAAFLQTLTTDQANLVTALVESQRPALYEIVESREKVARLLRQFMSGGVPDQEVLLAEMQHYGELDGSIIYQYAVAFAQVSQTLSADQLTQLEMLRTDLLGDLSLPVGAYLYSQPIPMPEIPNSDFLFK